MEDIKFRLAVDASAAVQGTQLATAQLARLALNVQRTGDAARIFETMSAQLANMAAQSDRAAKASERLNGAVSRAGHYASAFALSPQVGGILSGVAQRTDEYAALIGKLGLVSRSTVEATSTQARLFAVAQETRTGLASLGDVYFKLRQGTEALGISEARLLGVTRTMGQAMTLAGGSAESTQAALMQFSQGLASGTLRGEELNSVMEQFPPLAQALAEGMGRSVGELRKLAEAGTLTPETIIRALEASAGSVDAAFRKLPMTIGQASTLMSNSLLQTLGVMDQGTGLSRGFAQAIATLAEHMNLLVGGAGVAASVALAKVVAGIEGSGRAALARRAQILADRVAEEASAQATLRRAEAVAMHTGFVLADARATLAHATGLGASVVAQNAAIAATQRHSAALAAQLAAQAAVTTAQMNAAKAGSLATAASGMLGGSLGTVITLAGAAATAWAMWGASTTKGAQDAQESVAWTTHQIIADLDRQIAKLRERNRLRTAAPDLKAEGPGVDQLARLKTEIDRLQRPDVAAAMSYDVWAFNLANLKRQYEDLAGRVRALNVEQERSKAVAFGSVRDTWLAKYATDAEKLQAELKKATDEFKGNLPEDIERRIRSHFVKPSADDAQALAHYRNLVGDLANAQAGLSASYNDDLRQLHAGWKLSGDGVEIYRRAVDALIARQPFMVEQGRAAAAAREKEAAEYAKIVQATEQSAAAVAQRVQALQDEETAAALAGMAGMTLADAIEQVTIQRLLEARAAAMLDHDQERVDAINREIASRRELAGLINRKNGREQGARDAKDAGERRDRIVSDYLGTSTGLQIADGFDKASQSLAAFTGAFAAVVDEQQRYTTALAQQGLTSQQVAAIEARHAQARIGGYAAMLGAAKTFAREGSKDYARLERAERVFRAYQMAESLRTAAVQLGLIGTVTTAKVVGDTVMAGSDTARAGVEQGNSLATSAVKGVEAVVNAIRTMPFPLNLAAGVATGAAIAALGVAISGGTSSGSFAPTNTGTGTVLGEPGKASESIGNSIERLADIDTLTMRYSAQMAASLRSIEGRIGGVASVLARTGGVSAAAAATGVQEGFRNNALRGLEPLLRSGVFGTRTSIQAQGISAGPQSLGDIEARGLDASYFSDVVKKRKAFAITYSTSRNTVTTDAAPEVERQFSLVLGQMADSVRAAAGPLAGEFGQGLDDVKARLNAHVVDLGRIDLKGLSQAQQVEKLNAVFSAAADRMALAAMPGLERFTQVGEGYYETTVRVGTELESARVSLQGLGLGAGRLADLDVGDQDVSQALVRRALLGRDATRQLGDGVADMVRNFQGSDTELIDTWLTLDDTRTRMRQLGLDAGALGPDLLAGAGGLDKFAGSLADFEDRFIPAGQRVRNQGQRLAQQFTDLGLAMPATAAGYSALLRGIDTSNQAGKTLLGNLSGLGKGFGDLLDAVKGLASGLTDEIERIQGLQVGDGTTAGTLAAAQARFTVASAAARAGDQAALESLPTLSQGLLQLADERAGSRIELARLRASTLASLTATREAIQAAGLGLAGGFPGDSAGPTAHTAATATAGTSPSSPAPVAALPVVQPTAVPMPASAPASADPSGHAAWLAELAALRADVVRLGTELAGLRQDQGVQASALVLATQSTARALDRVMPDGDALTVRVVT
ncbi:tape measure protein [Leptothrix discophora]|uniref:Tape measure protein n=1 Tax=Leptothrix discophora TaxID=89 RepID=A0ABT9G1G5_LEPDI|nr:tape measure protein [Leptothrix discophora]MDP4300339.1 tape measure protein [Leptothrix discophora]